MELGLLPPDTYIPKGKKKRKAEAAVGRPKKQKTEPACAHDEEDEEEPEPAVPPEPMDPESSLDGLRRAALPTTVHWDPNSVDGSKIGWKVKVLLGRDSWHKGRVVRYDPYTHKHKIEANGREFWIWLRNEQHSLQLATRLVWAHIKGYPWWPAMVMETADDEQREGYVTLEFFGTGETSTLRETIDSIRPFSSDRLDPIVAKHKKKRNTESVQLAEQEEHTTRQIRNNAALFYATKAIGMANARADGPALLGKRVQCFRSDVNYPYGDTVIAKVRQYSSCQRKWLLSFEFSDRTNTKYEAAWINLQNKECALKVLDKSRHIVEDEDLVPYLFGFIADESDVDDRHVAMATMLRECCHGCVEYWKKDDQRLTCSVCESSYHFGCFDPPQSLETWQRLINDGTPIICSRCTLCRGCYQKDICFGSHLHPTPATLSFPAGEPLNLCLMCKDSYEKEKFCPNCARSWDDVKFNKVRRQVDWLGKKKRKDSDILQDTQAPTGSFTGDDEFPTGAKVDPTWFYPETSEWGFTEDEMLVCDACKIWVHAGCAGISEDDYDEISDGFHPVYSNEFLCRVCCRQRSEDLITALQKEDRTGLFAIPVTEKVAPNYRDVISIPMDLQTMLERARSEEYHSYAWVRELFERMVLNALTFNRYVSKWWTACARRGVAHVLYTVDAGLERGVSVLSRGSGSYL